MSGFEQVLWYTAIPASIVFAIQAALTFFGITHDHSDLDVEHHDGIGDHAYFPLFTIRNLVVFLMMFGWTGIAMIRQFHAGTGVTILVSTVAGGVLMAVVAFMFYGVSKLAASGNVVVDNRIVGLEAATYLKIPANRGGFGKVTVAFQGVRKELQATTAGPEIPTGAPVKIVELKDDGSVVVTQ